MMGSSQITPQRILDIVSRQHAEAGPRISLVKNGIAYVILEQDAERITERVGSTGAICYQTEVLFNLTELPGIDTVYFFDMGSHYSDGKWERIDRWKNLPSDDKLAFKKPFEGRLDVFTHRVSKSLDALSEIGDQNSIIALEKAKERNERTMHDLSFRFDKTIQNIEERTRDK